MSKFYEVSKVLDKRTDAHGRVQYLLRWRGYGKKNDSWVDEANTNERLKQVFRKRYQATIVFLNNTKGAFVFLYFKDIQ